MLHYSIDNFINPMQTSKSQMRGNIYNQSFKPHHKRKSQQTSQTIDALPSIHRSPSSQKTNLVRNQLNSTKYKITEMQARLKNLRNLKEQFQTKHQQNQTRINFISGVKDRVRQDQEHKAKIRQKRHQSLLQLKAQASDLRQSIVRQKKEAEEQVQSRKKLDGKEERIRHKHHEYLMNKLKEIDLQENKKKAERIRQQQNQAASKIKEFMNSRVSMSKDNYHHRLVKTLKERQKAQQTFDRLRQQQQRLLSQVKSSQQTMLSSLYSLITINPQKRSRKGSLFKDSEPSQNQVDNYDKEQFQT